jgi:hypothetical protein
LLPFWSAFFLGFGAIIDSKIETTCSPLKII